MMKQIRLTPEGSGKSLSIRVADTFLSRFCGLMGRAALPPGCGLLLCPCSSIHMLFMRFPIDAAFLDREYRIVKTVEGLPPWLGISAAPGAWGCLELPAGEIRRLGLAPGRRFLPDAPS